MYNIIFHAHALYMQIHSLTLETQTLESKLETAHREKNGIKQDLTCRITTLEGIAIIIMCFGSLV